jgi:eukaryotic-like serine/threonine-protein kinase
LDSATSQQLPATVGGRIPFWSPDSHYVGFFADGKLKTIDVSGGAPLTLAIAPSTLPGNPARGATWNREGTILFSSVSSAILRVSDGGGEAVPVTRLNEKTENGHGWPQFLPDGRHFIYYSFGKQPDLGGIYVGSLDGGAPKLLVRSLSHGAYASGYLLFMREDVLMAQPLDVRSLALTSDPVRVADKIAVSAGTGSAEFAASESGVVAYRALVGNSDDMRFSWADREGKRIEINIDPAMYRTHDLSPDGKRLAAHRHDNAKNGGDIWITELERGLTTRFTFDGSHNFGPIWSPDGSSIVYSSAKDGTAVNLYTKAASGAAKEELLLETSEAKQADDWSRDGKYIVYEVVSSQSGRDLWVLPLSGDRKPIPFLKTPFNERKGRFSPDGKWIAYTSNESGQDQIYIQPFPPNGGKWQISTNGGSEPRWRGDGKELYYVNATNSQLMAVAIKWSSIPEPDTPREIIPVQFGYLGVDAANQYVVTADGMKFIMQSSRQQLTGPVPITVLVNWLAALKK